MYVCVRYISVYIVGMEECMYVFNRFPIFVFRTLGNVRLINVGFRRCVAIFHGQDWGAAEHGDVFQSATQMQNYFMGCRGEGYLDCVYVCMYVCMYVCI